MFLIILIHYYLKVLKGVVGSSSPTYFDPHIIRTHSNHLTNPSNSSLSLQDKKKTKEKPVVGINGKNQTKIFPKNGIK